MPATLPWPKMPKAPAMEALLDAVAFAVLVDEEADDRLPDGETHCRHGFSLTVEGGHREPGIDLLVRPGIADQV